MKIKGLIIGAFLLQFIVTANAQVMSPISAGEQAAYLNFGLDPAVLSTIGYARGFEASLIKRDIMVSTEFAMPLAKVDLGDYRLKIGAQTSIINYNHWDLSIPVHLIMRGTRNWMHSATSFGADFTALFGYYREKWFINLELGYDMAFLTKITATDRYKKYYYSDFKNGWYGNTSHFFIRGIRAGYRIRRTEITLRAGECTIDWTAESNDLTPPFYGSLGVNYLF